ncbi:MAG: hypothetical protein VXY56_04925, partial [Pseudomonadota bacterium]|nr:hypothetical protein [Pseudomonadota bacterium]
MTPALVRSVKHARAEYDFYLLKNQSSKKKDAGESSASGNESRKRAATDEKNRLEKLHKALYKDVEKYTSEAKHQPDYASMKACIDKSEQALIEAKAIEKKFKIWQKVKIVQ